MSSSRDQVILAALKHGRVQSSGWVRITCPGFCEAAGRGPDTRNSFGFNTKTRGYSCNRCKTKGYVGGAHEIGFAGRDTRVATPRKHKEFVPLWRADVIASEALGPAYEYMRSRGFSNEEIYFADMHAAAIGKYAGRVIIPHKDANGSWWGFTARSWVEPIDGSPKVLYPAGMPRRIYNGHVLLEQTDAPCLAVEGCLDAVRYMPNCVAFLGKPTEEHVVQLLTAERPIVFALDGDAWVEGQCWANRLRLRGKDAISVMLPPGRDPATVDPQWLIDSARREMQRQFG